MIILKPEDLRFCQEFMFEYMGDFFLRRECSSSYKFCLEIRQTAKLKSIYPLELNNELFHQNVPDWDYSILFLTKR